MPLNCHMYVYLGVRMYNNIAITSTKKNITYLSVHPQPCIHRRINTKKRIFCMFEGEIYELYTA